MWIYKYLFVIALCICGAFVAPGVANAYECNSNQIDIGSGCAGAKFTVHTKAIATNGVFLFKIAAQGTFYVDCGDGGTLQKKQGTSTTYNTLSNNTINSSNVTQATYRCLYSTGNDVRTIRFGGLAEAYNASANSSGATISINSMSNDSGQLVTSVEGSLGKIFPTLGDSTTLQPNFYQTFYGAASLTKIPADLFNDVTGSRASMFSNTFNGCTSLEYIPYGLFREISGTADYMFSNTFNGCTSLTTLPEDLFAGITGGSQYLFSSTFNGCSGLVGYIPKSVFSGLVDAGFPSASNMMSNTFNNTGLLAKGTNGAGCTNLGLQAVTITANTSTYGFNGKAFCEPGTKSAVRLMDGDRVMATVVATNGSAMPTTDIFGNPLVANSYEGQIFAGYALNGTTYYYTSKLASARTWNQSVGSYSLTAQYLPTKFTVTTTGNSTFKFKISAKGTFYVDCGDGGTLSGTSASGAIINRSTSSTSSITEYSCTYSSSGSKTIRFSGVATAYDTDTSVARSAIQFTTPTYVSAVSGGLGNVFPTLGNGTAANQQPKFASTFKGCTNLTEIPSDLFDGVSGNGRFMFQYTFQNCTGLKYIPSGLFDSNSGGSGLMFSGTFKGCSGLGTDTTNYPDPIPSDLFENVNTAAGSLFSYVFQDCTGLKYIPSTLFANVVSDSSTSQMFTSAFSGCTGLTSLPENLFANITVPAASMFSYAFNGCSNLRGFIPPSMFQGLIDANSPNASSLMANIFTGTALDESCPDGYDEVETSYESYWSSKVACVLTPAAVYNISYVLNGGTNYQNAPTTYTAGTSVTINGTPTKNGYTFSAWCRERKMTDFVGTGTATNACHIDNSGVGGDGGTCSGYGLTSSDKNKFVADFDTNGWLYGYGRCSTRAGTMPAVVNGEYVVISGNIVDDLTDETGQTDARYCYCSLYGYTPYSGTMTNISTPWLFKGDKTTGANCAVKCSYECGELFGTDNTGIREAIMPKVCAASQTIGTGETGDLTFAAVYTANPIEILWPGVPNAYVTANNAGATVYDGNIRTPAYTPSEPGKTFKGWSFIAN